MFKKEMCMIFHSIMVLDIKHSYQTYQTFTSIYQSLESLEIKCVSLNNEPCMARPTLTDLNSVELNYYSFVVSLEKIDAIEFNESTFKGNVYKFSINYGAIDKSYTLNIYILKIFIG